MDEILTGVLRQGVLFSEKHLGVYKKCHIISDCNKGKAVTNINCPTAKTNALKLFEKQLKIEDSFHAKFLFDIGSALDIYYKLRSFF